MTGKNELSEGLPIDKDQQKCETFVRLAEIVQSGFNARRSEEWKIKFGFWGAFGIGFLAVDQKGSILYQNFFLLVTLIAGIVVIFGAYFIFELVFQRANMTDKEWKHYYMARAESHAKNRPPEGLVDWWKPLGTLWFWAYIVFTFALVLLLMGYIWVQFSQSDTLEQIFKKLLQ